MSRRPLRTFAYGHPWFYDLVTGISALPVEVPSGCVVFVRSGWRRGCLPRRQSWISVVAAGPPVLLYWKVVFR